MLLKNARIYQFTEPFAFDAESFEDQLLAHALQQCRPFELMSLGWSPVFGRQGVLSYAAENCVMFQMTCQQKILPQSVVNEALAQKVEELEASMVSPLRAKEKKCLKDEVTQDLLTQAFCRNQNVMAYIDVKNQFLVVGSASASQADQFIELLTTTLGQLKVKCLESENTAITLANWLRSNDYPADWVILDRCTLTSPQAETHSVIKSQGHDLMSDPIQNIINQGAEVEELAFAWQDRLEFTLTKDLVIKSIKYPLYKEIKETRDDLNDNDIIVADFIFSSQTISALIVALIEQFGSASMIESSPKVIQEKIEA